MRQGGLRAGLHRARRIVVLAAVLLALATTASGWLILRGEAEQRRALEDRFEARQVTAAHFIAAYVGDAMGGNGGTAVPAHLEGESAAIATLRSFIENAIPFRSAELFLVDQDGHVVVSNQAGIEGRRFAAMHPAFAGLDDRRGNVSVHGHSHFVSQGPVPGTPWSLVFAVDESELLAPVDRSMSSAVQWFGLGSVLVLGVLSLGLLHRSLRQGARLADSEERHRAILDAATDAFVGLDPDGRVSDWNVAAERLFGWSADEVRGRPLSDLLLLPEVPSRSPGLVWEPVEGVDLAPSGDLRHVVAVHRDGTLVDAELAVITVDRAAGGRTYAFLRDIGDRLRHEERLEELALTDGLTGLANRRAALQRLEEALQNARGHGAPVAVIYVDLDRFKPVNDRYGHATGDSILRLVAERLRMTFRLEDTVARMGGDEFVVICENLGAAASPETVVARLRGVLGQPYTVDGRRHPVTASIGLAVSDGDESVERLLDRADAVMYEGKATRQAFAAVAPGL